MVLAETIILLLHNYYTEIALQFTESYGVSFLISQKTVENTGIRSIRWLFVKSLFWFLQKVLKLGVVNYNVQCKEWWYKENDFWLARQRPKINFFATWLFYILLESSKYKES